MNIPVAFSISLMVGAVWPLYMEHFIGSVSPKSILWFQIRCTEKMHVAVSLGISLVRFLLHCIDDESWVVFITSNGPVGLWPQHCTSIGSFISTECLISPILLIYYLLVFLFQKYIFIFGDTFFFFEIKIMF